MFRYKLNTNSYNRSFVIITIMSVIKQDVSPRPLHWPRLLCTLGNMAAVRKHKRVAASQSGFLSFNSATDDNGSASVGRRKRVNKNKKKNWNKYSDIQDVEEFLEDVRLQEKATG